MRLRFFLRLYIWVVEYFFNELTVAKIKKKDVMLYSFCSIEVIVFFKYWMLKII